MMGLLLIVASMAGFVAGIAGVKFLIQPASSLRLDVFRPWRADPWPRGVQEDDEVRFDWSATKRPVSASVADPADVTTEDLPDGAVVVEHLGAVSVYHPRH